MIRHIVVVGLANILLVACSAMAQTGGTSGDACPSASKNKSLSVPLKGQETHYWCWAASTQMTMNYINKKAKLDQCTIVQDQNPNLLSGPYPTNCCADHGACTMTSPPTTSAEFSPIYQRYKFTANINGLYQHLEWKDVKDQIYCKKKPFSYTIEEAGNQHMVVVRGYKTSNSGVRFVRINDPLGICPGLSCPGETRYITYEDYVGGLAYTHKHINDHYDITYVGQ